MKFEVYSYEKTTRDGAKKFNVYNTKTESGKMVEMKFTAECGYPKNKKHFILEAEANYSTCKKTGRPIIWVQKIISEEAFEENTNKNLLEELMKS